MERTGALGSILKRELEKGREGRKRTKGVSSPGSGSQRGNELHYHRKSLTGPFPDLTPLTGEPRPAEFLAPFWKVNSWKSTKQGPAAGGGKAPDFHSNGPT